nr:Chain D, DNA primase [Xenopus laevis]8V5M_D Chain D, DNA primase [Xenopus laevis]8V5N_D Chain D, DNA primase [Xenopus laevis]8V5O_D Chain D, DNA primase [Xenopus laevis]8V6G_D Chain D, DNA primase [Xenopus laevis]8V6H_D Chain D, DNA primase [Xenopus laevis]8V6I_D Chain D, DNA primase [Xenopus laevis]8V6J_D Chain D, DNA primase [Xenopus laevis]
GPHMDLSVYDPASLPDVLPLYYRRLFPFYQYFRWLNYGGVVKNYFQHREFSFTLKDDVYVRYQSFNNQSELEKEMQKMCPYKIDIGAVYSHRPSLHNTVKSGTFQAQEKELVFDIDMTDYDDVRRCCSSADICPKCWTLMTIAVRILDRALAEDFGFKHRLWVYSGRRGVHCWVCDDSARKLSQAERSAVAEYLSVVKGGEETIKKVQLPETIHPFIGKSLKMVERYFEKYALVDQDILENKQCWDKVIALVPEVARESLLREFSKARSSVERWDKLSSCLEATGKDFRRYSNIPKEIMLQFCYPRLDVNVSKGLNHLLKSPFSVHPKTGRISVPIDCKKLDQFDPFSVPTISLICSELDNVSKKEEDEDSAGEGEPEAKKRTRDYKRTSLAPYIKVFEQFLDKLDQSRKGELLNKSDLKKEF